MAEQEVIRIDARGMKCPRPIIELAKARRRGSPGDTIEIVADDLAFESDVRAWCETTGNPLMVIETNAGESTARIQLSE